MSTYQVQRGVYLCGHGCRQKNLCSCNVIFMEGQASHSDSTGPTSIEFQSQDTKAAKDDDKDTHSAVDDEVSK